MQTKVMPKYLYDKTQICFVSSGKNAIFLQRLLLVDMRCYIHNGDTIYKAVFLGNYRSNRKLESNIFSIDFHFKTQYYGHKR